MNKVLVTGGAGYLGSILVPRLLDLNYDVTVLDSFRTGVASLTEHCHRKNLNIIRGDVRKARANLYKDKDIIIWLAAVVGAPACNKSPQEAFQTNYVSIEHLLQGISKDQLVIYPCTNAGYKTTGESVFCNEESPIEPTSFYAKHKVVAEGILLQSHKNSISLRLATLFGMSPRMRIDLLVNDFVYRATKDKCLTLYQPDFMRNMIHVRDAARGFIHAIDNFDDMKGQIYNLGLPEGNITKRQLCEKIQKHIPDFYFTEHPYHEDMDNRNFALDTSKIEATGFECIYGLDDGIDELIKGYQMLENRKYCNI